MMLALPTPWAMRRLLLSAAAAGALGCMVAFPPTTVALAVAATVGLVLVLRFPVVGLALLAFTVPWGSALTFPSVPSVLTPTEGLVGILACVWLVSLVQTRSNPFHGAIWMPWLGLFLLALALSTSQATDLQASARELLKWTEMVVVYLSAVRLLRDRTNVNTVVAAIVAGGVSQALLGYTQSFLNIGPAGFAAQRAFLRAYGTFDQPNPYAGYLNLVLPLALAMALTIPSIRSRWGYGLASAVLTGGVLVSESRAGLLAGALGVLVVLLLRFRRIVGLAGLGFLGLAGGAILAAYNVLPLGPFDKVLTALGLGNISFNDVNDANFSAVERAAHWLAGVRMFETHPILGVGIGNYAAAYPAYHPRGWYASLEHAHNYYINIAAEAGLVGLVAYVLMVGLALWYSYAALRDAREPLFFAAALGVTGALAATSCHNIFDVLFVHGITALLALMVALATVRIDPGGPAQDVTMVRLEPGEGSGS